MQEDRNSLPKEERLETSELIDRIMDYDNCNDNDIDMAAERLMELEEIVDSIPEIVEMVAAHCGKEIIERPCMYRRGSMWRYHKVRAGNQWDDAASPISAIRSVNDQN